MLIAQLLVTIVKWRRWSEFESLGINFFSFSLFLSFFLIQLGKTQTEGEGVSNDKFAQFQGVQNSRFQ